MAHFAELDENNIVLQVIAVDNKDVNDLPFPESEPVGIDFLNSVLPGKRWVQVSFNKNFRKVYPGPGYTFYPEVGAHGVFSSPPPADYFIWDSEEYSWKPPMPYPEDEIEYYWNFKLKQWSPFAAQAPETVTIG
jgi:hypothetical protein